jgi:hypothetical protein
MAVTRGYVQQLSWLSAVPIACIWVGSASTASELFFVQITNSDNDADIAFKRTLISALAEAQVTGCEVEVRHLDTSAEVSSVGTTTCDVFLNPLQLDGIEITQSIQDLSQSVPLIAGKRTVVRLYLSYYSSSGATVRGEITLRRSPSDPPVTIPSLNIVVLDPAQAGNLPVKRNDVAGSLNFVLPDTHTTEGPLAISIASITNAVTGASLSVGCERKPTVWFHASPPLRVRILGMQYTQGNPPVTYTPTNFDFQAFLSWLNRAYPVGRVVSSQAVINATATPPFACDNMNAQIAALRALDISAGGDQRTHYYGMVSDGGFFMRGCAAGVPSTPDPGTVASGPTGPANWGWDFDGSYGDWYGGHELGHTFGRRHPGFCGETQDDLNNYPYANGQLAGSDAGFAGFDVGDPDLNFPMAALGGTKWHDVMTYCNFQWLSVYTYQGVRLRLLAEDSLGAGPGVGPATGASSGGRPDERFPQRTAAQQHKAPEKSGEILVSVIAPVNVTSKQGKIEFVNPVPNGRASVLEQDSPVVLRVKRADGLFLRDYPVRVKLNSELSAGDDHTGMVDVVIAVDAAARVIELLTAGQVADTFYAGGSPSGVGAVRRVINGGKELRMRLELDRPLEENHSYSVQVSTDGGKSWQTLAVGLKEPLFTLDRSQFREGEEVQVRITATNGFESSIVTSEVFRV